MRAKGGAVKKQPRRKAASQNIQPNPAVYAGNIPTMRFKKSIAWGVAAVGFVAAIPAIITEIGNLSPEIIMPDASGTSDPFELPFKIRNRSQLFELSDIKVTCLAVASLQTPNAAPLRSKTTSPGPTLLLRGGTAIIRCPAPRGALQMTNETAVFVPSEKILLQVTAEYSVKFPLIQPSRTVVSPFFIWARTGEKHHWISTDNPF